LRRDYGFLTEYWAARLIRAYGTEARAILQGAKQAADLGPDFGATLTGAEVRWLIHKEFAIFAEDVIWRHTKLGLRLAPPQIEALELFMAQERAIAGGGRL
jgi:glycerol-3-phosphate dehydrogenase